MSLDINQIALHQLIKRDEQNLELVLRDSLLEPTETVVEMVAELHRVYSAKNKAYGLFSEESELAQTLRLQRQGEEDFLAFSRAATGRLRDELAKYPFADGGFVLFCHYRYLAVEYLLVAVLSNLSSMRVNENLDINPTHYLDINHADIVARIDLTEWETNPESTRYLTFLKGRVGRKVADFFMDFLGASEGLNAKAQNRGLLQAVETLSGDENTAQARQRLQTLLAQGDRIARERSVDEIWGADEVESGILLQFRQNSYGVTGVQRVTGVTHRYGHPHLMSLTVEDPQSPRAAGSGDAITV